MTDHTITTGAVAHPKGVRRERGHLRAHAEVPLKRHVFAERSGKIADVVKLGTAHAWAGVPDRQLSGITTLCNRLAFDLHDTPTGRRFRSSLHGVHHQLPQHHRLWALFDLARDCEVNVADRDRRNLLDVAHNGSP